MHEFDSVDASSLSSIIITVKNDIIITNTEDKSD